MSRQPQNFGNLAHDGSAAPIQIGNAFVTTDISASPNTSPLTYSSSVITLAVPTNAINICMCPSTAMRFSELVGMSTYFVIPASTVVPWTVGCANMNQIYIKEDSTGGALQFYFQTV